MKCPSLDGHILGCSRDKFFRGSDPRTALAARSHGNRSLNLGSNIGTEPGAGRATCCATHGVSLMTTVKAGVCRPCVAIR